MERVIGRQQYRIFSYALRLAILLYPSFFLLDWVVYPEHKYSLLIIRGAVTVSLFAVYLLLSRVEDPYHFPLILFSFFLVSFGISFMCFVTGDGFSSPYYAGLLQVIIIATLFFNIRPTNYRWIIIVIIVQHFLLLWFLPWTFKDLTLNILALGVFSLISILAHDFIYNLVEENKELKGFLPICAHCKKIRDDAGYWHQVEEYIRDHSEARFSHGICPDCAREFYPEYFKEGISP